MKPITINTLNNFKKKGERITCLTCYDSSFTRILEEAGIELLLVGDSLGNVLQGHANTLPVTIDNMVYHAACVTRSLFSKPRYSCMCTFRSHPAINTASWWV